MMNMRKPLFVGLGGTTRPGSSSERAMMLALRRAGALGAAVEVFSGAKLILPIYEPDAARNSETAASLIDSLRRADAILISSPCYHGGVSGLLKNALDYVEEMRGDSPAYFDGRAVGLISCGFGYQGPAMVLGHLREMVHALRGWPVPLGVVINSAVVAVDEGERDFEPIQRQLTTMVEQMMDFALFHGRHRKVA